SKNKFDHNAGDAFGGGVGTEKFFKVHDFRIAVFVGIRKAVDFRRKRSEAEFVRLHFGSHAHGQKRSAVKGVLEYDHAASFGVVACNFYRIFDAFRAAVGKHG